MSKIVELISGGQSGADRGAMDAAKQCGVKVGGWCPKGGWAEDFPTPPGVLELYPSMRETPLSDVMQRTEWNIRDSSCCVVLSTRAAGTSPGTDRGYAFYEKYDVPFFEFKLDEPGLLDVQFEQACTWLEGLNDDALVVSFGGPRASEYPGIYDMAFNVVTQLLAEFS